MRQGWSLGLLFLLVAGAGSAVRAQSSATLEAPTGLKSTKPTGAVQLDSARTNPVRPGVAQPGAAGPNSLTFTASTDQRFFFFNDTRNDENRRVPASVYGIRAGFLFPARHPRTNARFSGGRVAAFKAGAGFYFINQQLNRPGLLPNTSASVKRYLRFVMAFYEPYLLRKGPFEVSLPLEFGYGHSRYERNDDPAKDYEVARGVFLPGGVGISAAYQFPSIRWFRPLHWIGFNVLSGYRFVVKRDVPDSQINYNGLYLSIGPSFYLENFTADVKAWRQHRRKK